jgi:hypothetical protein
VERSKRRFCRRLDSGRLVWRARLSLNRDGWTGHQQAFLLDTAFPPRGDVDRNGCVDDTDLLRVLFEFGAQGYRNEDLNWDGTIDDADLLVVLFNFGGGC